MAEDALIHQSTRLRIMAALCGLAAGEPIEFARLRSIVEATDGNLGAHIETLAKAGYVEVEKRFIDRRPQTRLAATASGRQAFLGHVAWLRALLAGTA